MFEDLDQRSLEAIANAAVEQRYEPGQEIVRQGDTGVGAFIIRSGKVDIVQDREGEEPWATSNATRTSSERSNSSGSTKSSTSSISTSLRTIIRTTGRRSFRRVWRARRSPTRAR